LQEEIAEWDRKKLMDEIGALERRHKELVKLLSKLDPQIYVTKLQQVPVLSKTKFGARATCSKTPMAEIKMS
jgi:uncharacterized caspase-like protein